MTRQGVVAAGHPQTARAGAELLRSGGNAVDAVCAAAFASFVCEIPLTSPMGAGVLLHGSAEESWSVLDFFARTPGLGGRPQHSDFHSVVIDFGATTQEFHVGRGAAAVPGALRGVVEAHRQRGRLPLTDVVAPALSLARDGFLVTAGVSRILTLLEPIFMLTPQARELAGATEDGRMAAAGSTLRNPGQAHLLEGLARDPESTIRAVEADVVEAFGPSEGGWLTREDFLEARPIARRPLAVDYASTQVLGNPPPSAGGGLVALGLHLAEHVGLNQRSFGEHWGRLAQVLGAVSRARARGYDPFLGQPDFIEGFLSAGNVDAAWKAQQQAVPEPALGSTTHISVLDGERGAASLTTSNGEGCGHTLEAWGVHVNNFLGEEDINPHGFHTQAPGQSMTTMMAPTVVLREGRPVLVLGSGGSNRIRSVILQGLIHRIGFGRDLAETIDLDRLHVEREHLWLEATSIGPRALQELRETWPQTTVFEDKSMFFGGIHAVCEVDGELVGVADGRRDGAVCRVTDL